MMRLLYRFFEWIRGLFWTKEMELTILGLQEAGKTTFVSVIANEGFRHTIPTIGFNMRLIRKGNVRIKIWDLGGERRFRAMWDRYCRGIDAIIYIVDAADMQKLPESRHELHCLLSKPQLENIPLLVLGNKSDLENALCEKEFIETMSLQHIKNREVCCFMASCKNRNNIELTLQWLIAHSKDSK